MRCNHTPIASARRIRFDGETGVFTGWIPTALRKFFVSLSNLLYRIQDTGYRIQDTGYRIQDTLLRLSYTVLRIGLLLIVKEAFVLRDVHFIKYKNHTGGLRPADPPFW